MKLTDEALHSHCFANRHRLEKTKLQAERGHAKWTPMIIHQSGVRRAVRMFLLTKIDLKVSRTKCPKGRKTARRPFAKRSIKSIVQPRTHLQKFNLVEVHKCVQKVKENPERPECTIPHKVCSLPHLLRSLPHLVHSLLHQAFWFPTLIQMSHKVVQNREVGIKTTSRIGNGGLSQYVTWTCFVLQSISVAFERFRSVSDLHLRFRNHIHIVCDCACGAGSNHGVLGNAQLLC